MDLNNGAGGLNSHMPVIIGLLKHGKLHLINESCILLGFIKNIVDWTDFGLWLLSMNVRIEAIVRQLELLHNFGDR